MRILATNRFSSGFSMVEISLTVFFLAVVLAAVMFFVTQTGRTSEEIRNELLAYQIAREPIQVFRDFGFSWVKTTYLEGGKPPEAFPAGPVALSTLDPLCLKYPGEAQSFQREILVQSAASGNALRVTVKISPKSGTRVGNLFPGGRAIELRALILPTVEEK